MLRKIKTEGSAGAELLRKGVTVDIQIQQVSSSNTWTFKYSQLSSSAVWGYKCSKMRD